MQNPVILAEIEMQNFDVRLRSPFFFFLWEGILGRGLEGGATRRPCLSVFSDAFKVVKNKQKCSTSFSFALKFLSPSQAFPPAVCL